MSMWFLTSLTTLLVSEREFSSSALLLFILLFFIILSLTFSSRGYGSFLLGVPLFSSRGFKPILIYLYNTSLLSSLYTNLVSIYHLSFRFDIHVLIDLIVTQYNSAKYLLLAKHSPVVCDKQVISQYNSFSFAFNSLSYLTLAGIIA